MGEPIEHVYFDWLCSKVLEPHSKNHYELIQILFRTEFIWVIPKDKNRADDGVELREHFLRAAFLKKDHEWFDQPSSVLEVLIAFAGRSSFQTDIPVKDWFWIFLTNLGLDELRRVSRSDLELIEEVLYNFIWRLYAENGCGGLFPLDNPIEDQRKVEMWYQFCAYVDEQGMI